MCFVKLYLAVSEDLNYVFLLIENQTQKPVIRAFSVSLQCHYPTLWAGQATAQPGRAAVGGRAAGPPFLLPPAPEGQAGWSESRLNQAWQGESRWAHPAAPAIRAARAHRATLLWPFVRETTGQEEPARHTMFLIKAFHESTHHRMSDSHPHSINTILALAGVAVGGSAVLCTEGSRI